MSFRGRGGGGGRFAGRRTYQAPIKDENGNIKKPEPPTLFQDIKVLPVLLEIAMKDEELVSKRRKLDHFWELSPYYIENPKEKTVGVIAEIERYSDRYKPNVRINRPPLSSVLKLAAAYFPSEILNQGSKRARAYKGTSQWTVQPDAADLQKLDRLENLEQKAQQRSEKVGDKEPDEKKEGENEDAEEEEIEDEEEDLGDDDYNQNFGFDDDEDYLDMDDGGDIEEATY
ncbi:hypothetical protein SUGI_1149060 [Cryptomeria japonica]|uniref:uncharacterized protein LOC131060783 n=1 Tax=Cryptomeria japonica TaxID=3369 RepID=UPI00241473DF|nr:uncharacterized protein LOC131060783 [Cryptomeria japonica]XP_057850250.2 uncharacterized protein LOC131060783 [Cryptomeria japonica]XP_057850316.2 uncharacterized protein LOC131060783 [Cryptomeria japonica]XP_057850388.2 uncharacterized protein LOC131060783 [Cryptomeria japonica]GLJ53832.1 hypothetical protein SUGI_1149060 [Cryptomeria japonica]